MMKLPQKLGKEEFRMGGNLFSQEMYEQVILMLQQASKEVDINSKEHKIT